MPLQMDSTVLYAEHRDGGPVTSTDLALNTPYNTYLHTGLTPTPICFPSPASLQAALAPTPGNWLYFVLVSADGTEAFSDTFAGQQANEQLAKSRGLGWLASGARRGEPPRVVAGRRGPPWWSA